MKDKIYEIIKGYIQEKGYAPSVREIGKLSGLKSPSSVQHYISELKKEGRIRNEPGKPRTLILIG